MNSFSDRIGLTATDTSIQLNRIDRALLNRLWNVYNIFVLEKIRPDYGIRDKLELYVAIVWDKFLKEAHDEAPYHFEQVKDFIKAYFYKSKWFEVYNLMDFTARINMPYIFDKYVSTANIVLEQEYSGYRFINNRLAPISNSIEVEAVESALHVTQYTFDANANIHLSHAIEFISNKPNPDFRNAIKESISAVGVVVRKITEKNTLGDGLKYLDSKGLKINNQLKEGLNKFYNYTNDPATGIRHEIVDSPNPPDFETAKFMLLSCSAFINYLIPLAQKANIEIK